MSEAGHATAASGGGWDCHVHVFDAAAPVLAGHYRPVHRPLATIEALAAAHGIHHLVLVQPSVYGTDNAVMLQALEASGGRHRGVAVVDPDIDEASLERLHAAGVRGIRFNRVSPVGTGEDPERSLGVLAPRLRARGWHVQWYIQADTLPLLVDWQRKTGLPFVLDHLAGLSAGLPGEHPAWPALQRLAEAGAWVKLSGWYRLGATAPYSGLAANLRRVQAVFGDRLVWGSDWPHTSFAPDALPAYDSLLTPMRGTLGLAQAQTVLCDHAARLYDGTRPPG